MLSSSQTDPPASEQATASRAVAVKASQVCKRFGGFQALLNVDLAVQAREKIVVCGPSGSGKSTLLRCINGLERHDSGTIVVNGITLVHGTGSVQDVRREVGMVFQQFNLFPHMSVLDNCILAPKLALGLRQAQATERAMRLLARVQIADQAHKYPSQLSGGQQQLVGVARAIVASPSLILADEPTGNLHSDQAREIMELFKKLNNEGTTIIQVTHSETNAQYGNRIVRLRDGWIVQ
jgi:arginine/ornithine transport system ATP-binding protein